MFGFGGFGQPAVAAAVDPGVAALEGEFNKFFSLFGAPSTLTTPPKQATDRTIVEHSAFKRIFYVIRPSTATLYHAKPLELTDAEWKAALDNNKDDRLLWPTVVHGFSGLAKKLQEQSNSVKELQGSAKLLLGKLEATLLEAQAMSQSVEKLRQKRQRMAALRLRVLASVDRLLSAQTPVRPEEMAVRARLSHIMEQIRSPGVSLSSQLAEIESLRHIQLHNTFEKTLSLGPSEEAAIAKVLETQRQGLTLLQELIRKDARDLQLMLELLGSGDVAGTVRRVIADVASGSKGYSDVQYATLGRSDGPVGHASGTAARSGLFLTVEVDVQVRLVDQLQIIEFGKLNHLKRDILPKIAACKKEADVLEDAEEMAMLADTSEPGSLRILLGDAFVESDDTSATELVASRKEANVKKLAELEAQLEGINARQQELKKTLYGRFRNTINLEDE